ncbi:unnamed protein product [Prorocentrum cordatum]|uniref:Uncharacterized protein n=1 Tax=Prorocentrum cordatum TaxID=2364126 RepID=A0ABN9QJF1_9DINO|nr:unnamed protein product [Polarella glacialis]
MLQGSFRLCFRPTAHEADVANGLKAAPHRRQRTHCPYTDAIAHAGTIPTTPNLPCQTYCTRRAMPIRPSFGFHFGHLGAHFHSRTQTSILFILHSAFVFSTMPMALALLVVSLAGTHYAAGLASSGDLQLMQMWPTPTASKDDFGREFFTHAGVRIHRRAPNGRRTVDGEPEATENKTSTWMFMIKEGTTGEMLQSVVQELHPTAMSTNPDIGEVPFVEEHLD